MGAANSGTVSTDKRPEHAPRRLLTTRNLLLIVILLVAAAWLLSSPKATVAIAVLGLLLWAVVGSYQSRSFRKRFLFATAIVLPLAIVAIGIRTWLRYRTADVMEVSIREFSNAEYPEDPSGRSVWLGMYQGRRLRLERKDATHFDFVFEPLHPQVAQVTFKNVDVSLMTPNVPEWTKQDPGLLRIALTDRQWNRQQVRFGGPDGGTVVVTGGDGWEAAHLYSAELAKNCLNAGLWEVLLSVQKDGQKEMYYQGWFTFPMGLYKEIVESNTGLAYWRHWYYLEHWFDPAGTLIPLEQLRSVERESEPMTKFNLDEPIMFAGEQVRKRRTTMAENVRTWGDFFRPNDIHFAAFVPPGRYSDSTPWSNEYPRIDHFEHAVLRKVRSPASNELYDELELVFSSSHHSGTNRFLVSGFQIDSLPKLSVDEYPKGLYMPMGIGVPPFYQDYAKLQEQPPNTTAYFSVLVDEHDRWIDHHHFAIDGPVMHRDATDPKLLHVYLLSYERHSLIGHWVISIPNSTENITAGPDSAPAQ